MRVLVRMLSLVVLFIMILVPVFFIIGFVVLAAGIMLCRTLDDLIQLAAIKPDAAALGAVINFNSLFIGNEQGSLAVWTFHSIWFFVLSNIRPDRHLSIPTFSPPGGEMSEDREGLNILNTPEPDMVRCAAVFAFAARAHHVAGAVLIGAEVGTAALHFLLHARLGRVV